MTGGIPTASRGGRVVAGAAWLAAVVFALGLAAVRFRAAVSSSGGPDFEGSFLGAAGAILQGTSPYDVVGYVYSPFVGWLLVPLAEVPWARTAWIAVLVGAALVASLAATLASVRTGKPLHRPLVLVLASGTLFLSWTVSMELWMGQVDLLVLLSVTLAMLAAAHGIRGGAGLSLGLGALVKTWPAGLVLWLLHRPQRGRALDWLGFIGAGALAAALALAVGGGPAVLDMAAAPIRMSSQPLVAYSVWGAGTILFTDSGLAEPVIVSDALSLAVRAALAVWVLVLLGVTLRRPGSSVIALPNVAFVVVLLLPVSHYVYLLLPLPALWWWAARALEAPRRWESWVTTAVLLAWWHLAMRRIPAGDTYLTTDVRTFLLIFGSTLVAATVSVLAAARLRGDLEPSRRAEARPSNGQITLEPDHGVRSRS